MPFVRRRAGVALIGLSTAVASPPLMATGRLGASQTARLTELLAALRTERLFRVVLIHHPPESEPRRRRERLLDADVFRNVLAKAGAELVLHGHEHVSSVTWLDGPERRIPAVGVPSASAAPGGRWQPAGYNLFRIEGEPDAWRCEMIARGFRPGSSTIGELGRRVLLRPRNLEIARRMKTGRGVLLTAQSSPGFHPGHDHRCLGKIPNGRAHARPSSVLPRGLYSHPIQPAYPSLSSSAKTAG